MNIPSTISAHPPFRAFSGSVTGLEHRRLGRNNQDASSVCAAGDVSVAVVADGCSSGAYSEVGARLGAAWIAAWLPSIVREHAEPGAWATALERRLVDACGSLARSVSPDARLLPSIVAEHLLFSFLVAVVARGRAVIFGAGDGVYSVDGEAHVLPPGEGNAPAYLAYALLDGSDVPRVAVLFDADARQVSTLAVCTDGALDLLARRPGELARLERDPRLAKNPSLLRKRLTVLAEAERLLADDTTIAVLSREEGFAP